MRDGDNLAPFGRLKLAMDHGSPGISQLVGARLLQDADAHRERARAQVAARIAAAEEALTELLPDWRWRAPEAVGGARVRGLPEAGPGPRPRGGPGGIRRLAEAWRVYVPAGAPARSAPAGLV